MYRTGYLRILYYNCGSPDMHFGTVQERHIGIVLWCSWGIWPV